MNTGFENVNFFFFDKTSKAQKQKLKPTYRIVTNEKQNKLRDNLHSGKKELQTIHLTIHKEHNSRKIVKHELKSTKIFCQNKIYKWLTGI